MTSIVQSEEVEPAPVYLTYEDYPEEDLFLYAGIDCLVTTDLAAELMKEATKDTPYVEFISMPSGKIGKRTVQIPSVWDAYQETTSAALEFIIDLELNGIAYNVPLNRIIDKRMVEELGVLEERIFTGIGRKVNLNSGLELRKLLYEEEAFEVKAFTKTGEPSTDGDAVKELAKAYPKKLWLPDLAKRNDINSLRNTFVATYHEDFVKSDRKIHPSYNLHGTGSFRISGEEPNLTQLPRPKHAYNLRTMYGEEEGTLFLAFDFSSAEVKILGALCRDPALLRAIEEGKDFHSVSAAAMFGVEYEVFVAVLDSSGHHLYKQYKEWRQASKALTFGILYGSSPNGIAFNLNITLDKANQLIALYFDNFPGIKTYVELTHRMAKENKYVINAFGQRKWTYGLNDVFKGTAVYNGGLRLSQNVRVQSTSSTFGLICFTRFNEEIKRLGGKCTCTVYDSIEAQVPIHLAAQAVELGFKILDDDPVSMFPWLTLPVGVDAEIGINWGEAKHVPRGITQEEIERMLCLN